MKIVEDDIYNQFDLNFNRNEQIETLGFFI